MSMRKSRLSLYRTACLLLMLTLVISSAGPASAQLPGTGGESSQQPYSGESPTTDSPWGAPSTSTQLSMLSNTDKQYVAATWTDNAVHFLDGSLNNTGSFAIGNTQPNGIATDGVIIYVGIFNMSSVRAFDYAGNLLNSWSDARLDSVQGLELVDGTLAAYESDTNQIHFYNPSTGVYLRSIPGEPSTEGLAYDGVLLWQLSSSIVGISPADGTVVRSIPNAGSGCDFEGSALSADGSGKLVIGCSNGNWYRVSSLDGAVLASGNNGLQMFGLGRSPIAQIHAAYMRSTVGPPWGVNTNETAMSRVFEAGHWQDLRYETVNPAILFSPSTNLIFMEGSDTNANELEAFLATHQDLLETWVAEGGCLLLNAAPNEGNGMSFGFGGVNLTYPAFSLTGVAPNPAHPIFNGPFLPAGSSYTGEWFSHGSVSGGDITALLSGDNSTVPLAEKDWGFGQVVFGGMPTTNFHYPQPNATNLRANILYYLTTFGCEINAAPVAGDDGDVFYEDFESGYASWTMTGLWNPENQFDVCGNTVKPFASPFNAAYFGVDGICNYNTGQVVTGALTLDSPISLPANSSPRLVFSSYEETEDVCDVWDFRYVEISTDGGSSWNLLDHLCNEGTWIMYDFDLSAYAGENILLRFRFDSIDADSNGYFGWMVDNIAVRYTPFNFVTDEDSPFITPNVLANDSDRYGDPLIVDSYDTSGLLGTLNYNNNGTFTYDPVGAFESLAPGEQTLETFSYVTSDGVHTDTAHVYIVVTGVNDTPEAVNDSFSTPEDLILNQAAPGVLGNDSDPEGDAITAVLVQPPAVGSLTQNPNGSFNYTPAANYNGVVNYTYAASDGVLMSSLKPVDVRFDEPEFPLNTVVNGYVTDSLYGYAIPPLGFSFMVNGVPSNSAKFANIGPESAA